MSRRAKITPAQAGLPPAGRRRVPGLRRIEVAMLAGVSVEYYSRLERGDAAGVSESILDAIAGALQLDDAERSHLLDLVRTSGATRAPRRRTPVPRDPADRPVRPRRHHRSARDRPRRPPQPPGRQRPRQGPLLAVLRHRRRAAQQRPVHLPRPPRPAVPARLGQGGRRHRRHPARRSRPRPLRPQPVRPHRRTLHPQRGVPDPLGLPRRPHPRHRHQTTPPPRRRRPRPLLRVIPHARPGPEPPRLRRRTSQPVPRRAQPPRQLRRHPPTRRRGRSTPAQAENSPPTAPTDIQVTSRAEPFTCAFAVGPAMPYCRPGVVSGRWWRGRCPGPSAGGPVHPGGVSTSGLPISVLRCWCSAVCSTRASSSSPAARRRGRCPGENRRCSGSPSASRWRRSAGS